MGYATHTVRMPMPDFAYRIRTLANTTYIHATYINLNFLIPSQHCRSVITVPRGLEFLTRGKGTAVLSDRNQYSRQQSRRMRRHPCQRLPLSVTFILYLVVFVDVRRNGCAGATQYYEEFSYDGLYYYLPDGGSQVRAKTQDGWMYQYYTDFQYNGALISSIQTRVDGVRVRSIRFTDNYGKQYDIGGNFDDASLGEAKGVTLKLASQERIVYLLQQGDDDKLCRFYLELQTFQGTEGGEKRSVELGGPKKKCDGDQNGTSDVASGLIGGWFGKVGDQVITQLGLLFLQDIQSIVRDTNDITGYQSDPSLSLISGYTIYNRDSGNVAVETTTMTKEEGKSYSYSYSQSWEVLAGVAVAASYKWSTVTETSESEISGEITFEYGLSTATSAEKTQDSLKSLEATKTFCCPPYYDCSWGWYQGKGTILDSNPVDASITTTVTFKTGGAWTFEDSGNYFGTSVDDNPYQIGETSPEVPEGEDPFAICNESVAGRKLLQDDSNRARNFTLNLITPLDQPIELLSKEEKEYFEKKLEKRLRTTFNVQGDIDLEALLEPFFKYSTIPEGTVVKSVYKGYGVVSKLPN